MTSELTLDLHAAWWPLGDGSATPEVVADAVIEDAALPESPEREALRAQLVGVGRLAAGLPSGSRWSWALVRDPRIGRAEALLSVRASATEGDLYARYLTEAGERVSTETTELIQPRVLETVVPGGRVIVTRDFTRRVVREGVMPPVMERCTAGVFLNDENALLEITLITPDLALFDDIVDYVLNLASEKPSGAPGVLRYDGDAS